MPRYVWNAFAPGEPAPGNPRPPEKTPSTTPRTAPPSVPTTPPATVETTWANLLPQYYTGLKGFIGDPATFYAGRGGEKQAQQDYYNLLNAWTQKAGVPLTPDDWSNVWANINAYRTGGLAQSPARAFTMSDANRYLNRLLTGAPNPTPVTFLRTGII